VSKKKIQKISVCRSRSLVAFCAEKQKASTRLVSSKDKDSHDDPPFDWKKFFSLLKPHILQLLAAIAVKIIA